MEKLTPQKKNVPENATKHGGNCVAMETHPGFWGKTWRNYFREEKCPEKRHKTWRKLYGGGKHPGFAGKTWRNSRGGGETSWFWG